MKLRIKITKDVLRNAAHCDAKNESDRADNCAVALAIRGIFPRAKIHLLDIMVGDNSIPLPIIASQFIQKFDWLKPEERINMDEFSFEIEIPDSTISTINIEDAFKKLEGHQNLELILC